MFKSPMIIWMTIWFVFIPTAFGHPVFAAEESHLDEILDGFEETSESADDNQHKESLTQDPTEVVDDVLKGFDDEEIESDTVSEKEKKPFQFSIDGHLALDMTYNFAHDAPEPGQTDWRGLSMFRPELFVELKKKFSDKWRAQVSVKAFYDLVYSIKGRDEFTGQVLDENEEELELEETFVIGELVEDLDLKFGRQIVVWGTSDNIRINDVLNPLDLRAPGLVDIEFLRLPVTMTKLDYYTGRWNISGIAINEVRFNKEPAFGSDFFPGPKPLPPQITPSDSFDNTQFAAALIGIFSGWDMAFYLGDIYDARPHQEIDPGVGNVLKHARLKLAGAAFDIAKGNWLFKSEAAFFDGLKFFNDPGQTYTKFDALVGVEYSGFHETMITVELANRHILGYHTVLKTLPNTIVENEFQTAFRLTREFLNDTLKVTVLGQIFGGNGKPSGFERLSAEYDLTDTIQLTGGVVFYQSGDLPRFRDIGDNDRLFLEIRYSF